MECTVALRPLNYSLIFDLPYVFFQLYLAEPAFQLYLWSLDIFYPPDFQSFLAVRGFPVVLLLSGCFFASTPSSFQLLLLYYPLLCLLTMVLLPAHKLVALLAIFFRVVSATGSLSCPSFSSNLGAASSTVSDCQGSLSRSRWPSRSRPHHTTPTSSYFLCLAVLHRPTAPGGSNPTSSLFLRLAVLPRLACIWRFYPDQFFADLVRQCYLD